MKDTIEYLDDGVYVDWSDIDGGQVRLFTERDSGTHEIYLSPEMIDWLSRRLSEVNDEDR